MQPERDFFASNADLVHCKLSLLICRISPAWVKFASEGLLLSDFAFASQRLPPTSVFYASYLLHRKPSLVSGLDKR
jgi:hypothetical protein